MPAINPVNFITNCLSSTFSNEALASPTEDDWDNIAVTAIAVGLAPLLHWHLERRGITLPAMATAKLGVTRQAHAKRNRAIAHQLAEILRACAAQNVDVLVLKGALLAATAYPEAALRPMNDVDLLFRPDDLAQIGPILESLGYTGKHKTADQGPGVTKHLSTYRRDGNEAATPNPYLSAGGDRMVEPHGSLEESWFGLKVDMTPGVWERAVPVTLTDLPAYRLSTSDTILHLGIHATFHVIMGASVFVQLYDLGQVLRTWSDQVDWRDIITRAKAAEAEPFLYAALYWANTIFAAPVSDQVMSNLQQRCPTELLDHIQTLDATALFSRAQQSPLVTIQQRLWRGIIDRRETARWASSPRDKWKVWQTALAIHKTDTLNLLQKRLKAQA